MDYSMFALCLVNGYFDWEGFKYYAGFSEWLPCP